MKIKMRSYLTMVLLTVLFTSCQSDNFIVEDLTGSWNYVRQTSETFNFLLDTDLKGTMFFDLDGSGVWNDSEGTSNFNLEWVLLDGSQEIELTKFDQDQNLEFVEKKSFNVTRINNSTIMLEWMEELPNPFDASLVIVYFEKIELKRM
jgi:hypothetical protein